MSGPPPPPGGPFDPAQCTAVVMGIPPAFEVTIEGITDGTCNECDELNGTFQLEFEECGKFTHDHAGICMKTVEFVLDPGDCSASLEIKINGTAVAEWSGSSPDGTCIDAFDLDQDSSTDADCEDYPSTVSIEAVDPEPEEVEKAGAVAVWNLSPSYGIAPLSPSVDPFGPPPYEGNCATGCGCDGGDSGCDPDPPGGGGGGDLSNETDDLGFRSAASFPPPVCVDAPPPAFSALSIIGSESGGGSGGDQCVNAAINPATGNLAIQFSLPGSGSGVAKPSLTYNSNSLYAGSDLAGPGWSAFWEQGTSAASDSVEVSGCDGSVRRYSCKDGTTGEYKVPGMNGNTMVLNGDGSLTETEPSGREYRYVNNELSTIRQPATGDRWTIARSFPSTPPGPISLRDPQSRRTTILFDTDGVLSIEDIHNRKTNFSLSSGVRTISNPELCETKFKYKTGTGNERLIEWLELADGGRFTFGYDTDKWVNSVINPFGKRMTLTYNDFTETVVDAYDGGRYTLSHTYRRNVKRVTSPAGVVTTYNWDFGRLDGYVKPGGVRITYIHARFNGHRRLQTEASPFGRKTFSYDSDGLLESAMDLQGNRTTYLRDAAGLVTTVVRATGARTSYVYDSDKRPVAKLTPLGGRMTNIYGTGRQVNATIDAYGNRTSYTYHNGQRQTVKTPLGNVSTVLYDDLNRPVATVNPLGNRSTFVYETSCTSPVATVNPLGNRSTNIYDNSRLVATVNALDDRTTYTYNNAGQVASVKTPMGYVSTTVYNDDGRVVASISPAGLRSTSVYDASGRRLAGISPNGARTTLVYNDNGQVAAAIDPYGNRTTTVFDGTGRAIASVNPLGARSTTLYAATFNRVVATVNPLGNRATTVYDTAGLQVAAIDPLGNRTTSVYDIGGAVVATISPLGNRSTGVYDADRNRVASVNPLGDRRTTVYDAARQAVAGVNPLGSRTTTAYDSSGRPIAHTNAAGGRSTIVYDATAQRIASINAMGSRSTTIYNANRQTVAEIDPLGNRTTFLFDSVGRRVATKDAREFRTTTIFDSVGQVAASISALGERWTSVYDSAGRRISTINPLGDRTTTAFDKAGRVVAQTIPSGIRLSSTYDAVGQLISVIDGNGNRTTTVYNVNGQATTAVNALSHRTTTILDAADKVRAVVDARGNRSSFAYDLDGRRVRHEDPLGRLTSYSYDSDGNQVLRIDARGNRTSYQYSAIGGLTRRLYPDGARVTLEYDAVGQQTLVHGPTGRYSTSYDAVGRPRVVANPNHKTITYAYDLVGNRVKTDAPDSGVFTYSHDGNNQVTLVHNPFGKRVTFAYDGASRRTTDRLANGSRASYSYDADGNLITLYNLKSDGSAICTFDYQYDAVGNRTSVLEGSGARVTWTYDHAYQLIVERRSGGAAYTNTFAYDPVGNRILRIADGIRTTATYDLANQISYDVTTAGRTTYTFDADGNQRVVTATNGERLTTIWDYENQPSVHLSPGATTTMTYNAGGQRVGLKGSSGTTSFVWDEARYLSEANTAPIVFTNEPSKYGNIISQTENGNTLWYHFDATGNTRNVTNDLEQSVESRIYDAWGAVVSSTGTAQATFRFGGRFGYYPSPGGAYYIRSRTYSPQIARWLSVDPMGFPDTSNRFVFVANSPTTLVDPSGLACAEVRCGADITDWFERQLRSVKHNADRFLPLNYRAYLELFASLKFETIFDDQHESGLWGPNGECFSHACAGTATLCGICIDDATELGNIAFGYGASKNPAMMLWGGFFAEVRPGKPPRGFDKIKEIASALIGYAVWNDFGSLCETLARPPKDLPEGAIQNLINEIEAINDNVALKALLRAFGIHIDILQVWDLEHRDIGPWQKAIREALKLLEQEGAMLDKLQTNRSECSPCDAKSTLNDIFVGPDGTVQFPVSRWQ